ncbi:MAG: amidohydrolase family protein [Candidatus Zipacnadales bacterium]
MRTSSLTELCRLGQALTDELVIDAHTHMGPWHNFHIPHCSAVGMIERMDQIGIDMCISSPHLAISADYREGNRQVMAAADAYPHRIVPYVTINPNYPEEEIRTEIAHWSGLGRIKAFKIHPSSHQYKVDGPGYGPLFEYAREHSLPILSHSWAGDSRGEVSLLSQMAGDMPNVTFIVGHAASSWAMIEEACREAAARENVILDLTGSQLLYFALEKMTQRVGAEKIVFGSDMPFIDPAPAIGRVLMSRLTDEEKRKVLGLNAKRIFRL